MHFLSIDLPLAGEILDLGGGGEGVIGRAYGHQVTAIDNRQEELDEAPGNFRRMLMDATDLSFPDSHFAHVTAFFTMMYMDKTTQLKAIREAARVLKPGGELHLWDAEIDRAEPEPFCVEMDVSLPAERIHTTYGIVKPDAAQNAEYFIGLCETTGLRIKFRFETNGVFYLCFQKEPLPTSVLKEVISMNRIIPLWPGEAPYTAQSPDQAQPSIKEFKVEGSRGAVVVCPGGGYACKAPHEGDPIAEMINEAGVSAYVLDYRVAPCHCEAPLSDASRAIRVVRAMGYEKVAILGFSAGGNLCCSAATLYTSGDPDADDPIERLSSRPDAFIPCYAVASLCQYTHSGTRQNLLGEQEYDMSLVRRFSSELNVTPDTPTAFLWHTSTDEAVPVENSLNLALALAAKGVPFELHVFPKGQHGLGLAPDHPDVAQWTTLCQNWLKRQGFAR